MDLMQHTHIPLGQCETYLESFTICRTLLLFIHTFGKYLLEFELSRRDGSYWTDPTANPQENQSTENNNCVVSMSCSYMILVNKHACSTCTHWSFKIDNPSELMHLKMIHPIVSGDGSSKGKTTGPVPQSSNESSTFLGCMFFLCSVQLIWHAGTYIVSINIW